MLDGRSRRRWPRSPDATEGRGLAEEEAHGQWKLTYDPDTGTKTWTSPLGKTSTKSTDPVLG